MLFPSASFLLSALIAHCVADPKNLNHEYQVQGSAWPPLDPITGEQLSKTHVELAKCIEREKSANLITNLQKELSDSRLAQFQQNASYACSNAKNLLEKWQTCESRINSTASAGATKTSPKSTQKLIKLSNGSYYISSPSQKANWYIASKMCRSYNMELASVETEEENDALKGEIARFKEHFYISGTDLGSEGKFYWASTGKPFGSFHDWSRIKAVNPDNQGGVEHCVHYVHTEFYGKLYTLWNDIPCDKKYRYICESIE